jgi:hypothetical protein
MSNEAAPAGQSSGLGLSRGRLGIASLTILCCFVVAAILVTHRAIPALSAGPTSAPVAPPAPQGQQPVLSKEYIYAGARLLATEQPCSYVIAPTCAAFNAQGSEGSFSVTTAGGCGWTAVSNASWITISSQSSGTASATINFVVRDNTTSAGRQATISIAGLTFAVTQSGISTCSYAISPSSATFGPGGGVGTLNVAASPACGWQAVSSNNWVTITSGRCGLGSGPVSYSVGVNTAGATRTTTITVNGKVFAIKQTGV